MTFRKLCTLSLVLITLAFPLLLQASDTRGTVLITGANRGIGLELCHQLADRGDDIIAICRQSNRELEQPGITVIDGIEGMEGRATAFFLDSAAYLRPDPNGLLTVVFSTDSSGPLAAGTDISDHDALAKTVEAAFDDPGRILLGPPLESEGEPTASIVALSVAWICRLLSSL